MDFLTHGPRCEKTFGFFWNNTGADQAAHPHSLISAFVIRFLESIICNLTTGAISIFYLVSVANENWFETHFFRNPEDRFSRNEAHIMIQQN